MLGRRKENVAKPTEGREPAPASPSVSTPTSLRTAPAPTVHKRLGELLVQEGLVTEAQLAEAVAIQQAEGGFLGHILMRLGYVKQDDVASCLVKQCKIPHLSLLDYEIGPQVLSLVPQEVCKKYHLLPIDKLGRILTVAMVDPLDLDALEEVRRNCPELRIKPILCNWEHFDLVFGRIFVDQGAGKQNGGNTLTAKSLGLTRGRRAPKAPSPAPAAKEPAPERARALGAASASTHPPELQASQAELAESMRETFAELVLQLRANAQQERQNLEVTLPDMGQFAEVIRDSVGGVVQEAMAEMVVQLQALVSKTGGESDVEGKPQAEGLAQTVRESVLQALSASPQTPAGQESRLTEIAEAMLQSVQQASHLIERSTVGAGNRQALGGARHGAHQSVVPFGKGGGEEGHCEADLLVREALDSEHPLESLTFDSFLPGSANAFTAKLSRAVAENPGGEYNPFFLYGDVGTGKTHLISAMGNAILVAGPERRVGYVSASHFSRRLSDAMQDNAVGVFRENYCHWDVLILDDIQFMGGRVEAQEEFFHIFNVLYEQGRQIIIASDKAPDRLGLMEERLVSRFASGIVAELRAPERETRMEILRRQVSVTAAAVPEEILSLIAMRVPDDVRKMTGSLRKIVAFAKLVGQEMSCEMADEILNHLGVGAAA